ncbi:MAG: class I SAM-dependent rRNA methyltransferase [Syntrophorhabdaceae bacterium]|nr:class I SAM-dependent rRNA methyltransferase [Syntrophorhabdaceae bacterium]
MVKKEKIGPILGHHPWVFSHALTNIPEGIKQGEPIRLITMNGDFLASGYFNGYSQIAVRIWGYRDKEEVDEGFFIKRLRDALDIRRRYVESEKTDAYRVVNGENDWLPGLIVDKYGPYIVVQFHTRGIYRWKEHIVSAIEKLLTPKGIYERSDIPLRTDMAEEELTGLLYGSVPDTVEIKEHGLKFLVDIKHGQKTGFFLDQRDKRVSFIKYAKEKDVLNCFSYTGGFSVYALAGGAKSVVSVDTSSAALELARENVAINGFDLKRCIFVCADVKDYLMNEEVLFDAIVLDPPAFIKDRKKKREGVIGYKRINEMALKTIKDDGILVTCSCSAHLGMDEFRFILVEAGAKTHRLLNILEAYTHGIDHPQGVAYTEGGYLKSLFIHVKNQDHI